ncbi:hypothetical protein Pelo_2837 [Pelomyxa schiedti]|nr:hypothetical protein Pelo_2837 [Pelomyxa schiedti]
MATGGATHKCCFVYLHGLLSSGKAHKAQVMRSLLSKFGPLVSLDLYPRAEDLESYTITKGMETVDRALAEAAALAPGAPVVLMGSSCGGLLALRYLQTLAPAAKAAACPVRGLVLFAPAVEFAEYTQKDRSLAILCNAAPGVTGQMVVDAWRASGWLQFPADSCMLWPGVAPRLAWGFFQDLEAAHSTASQCSLRPGEVSKVLVVHGGEDDIVPPAYVRHWMEAQKGIGCVHDFLVLEHGNHQLNNVETQLMDSVIQWVSKNF